MSETTNTDSNTPSQETPKTSPGASPQSLNECLQRVQNELAQQEKRLSRSTTITAIVGTILLLLLGAYFVFGYVQIAEIMEPKMLVSASIQLLEDNLPDARQSLEAAVDKSAETWAEQLSEEAVAGVPTARVKLEDYIVEQTDDLVKNTTVMTAQQFRAILREHRPALERGFDELASSEKLSEASLAELEKALEKTLKTDIEDQAHIVLETLLTLTARIRRLAAGEGLSPEEQLERQMLMNARRLQSEQAEESSTS